MNQKVTTDKCAYVLHTCVYIEIFFLKLELVELTTVTMNLFIALYIEYGQLWPAMAVGALTAGSSSMSSIQGPSTHPHTGPC